MKSVLISIKPKYCELIANGEKTIEVRKTKPKLETPFKCYIYCTEAKYKNKYLHTSNKKNRLLFWHNKGDCEIICEPEHTSYTAYSCNGKVIGEFVCDEINEISPSPFTDGQYIVYGHGKTMLRLDEFQKYLGYKIGYGWHISDLKIYDEPKEITSFYKEKTEHCGWGECDICKYGYYDENDEYLFGCNSIIKRPPQSWCYVEELRDV